MVADFCGRKRPICQRQVGLPEKKIQPAFSAITINLVQSSLHGPCVRARADFVGLAGDRELRCSVVASSSRIFDHILGLVAHAAAAALVQRDVSCGQFLNVDARSARGIEHGRFGAFSLKRAVGTA